MFVKNEDGTFDRFEEQHYQHGFTIDEVTGAVNKAGLTVKMCIMHLLRIYLMISRKDYIL